MSDKVLIALRGLIRGQKHWGQSLEAIDSALQGVKILTYDIPGNGTRYQEQSLTDIDQYVDDLRSQMLEDISAGTQVHIFAMSLGAMIGSRWVQRFPDDFRSAIFANTSFKGISPIYKRLRPKAMAQIIRIALSKGSYNKEKNIIDLVSNEQGNRKNELIKSWSDLQNTNPVSYVNAFRQIWAARKFAPSIEKPKVPILLIASLNDRLCSVECSQAIAKAWDVELRTHPSAGHELAFDAPDWTKDQIEDWLYKHSA